MPRKKETLPSPTVPSRKVLEPEPPFDLMEQVEALCAQHGMTKIVEPTPDMFTAAQLARRWGMSPSTAGNRIRRLVVGGKIAFVGTGLNNAKFYRIKK